MRTTSSKEFCLIAALFLGLSGCAEDTKKEDKRNASSTEATDVDTSDDDSDQPLEPAADPTNPTPGATASADVCTGLKARTDLSEYADLVTRLCGTGKHSVVELRKKYYTGGSSTINYEFRSLTETTTFLLTYAQLRKVTPAGYHAMVKSAFLDPTTYLQRYEVLEGVSNTVEDSTDPLNVIYHYTNTFYEADSPPSVEDYRGSVGFFPEVTPTHFVIGFKMVEAFDSVEDYKSLLVINQLPDGQTESFVIYQGELTKEDDDKEGIALHRAEEHWDKYIALEYSNLTSLEVAEKAVPK
jgi:hypothetical protein